jgi:hypothetical protein
VTARRSVSLAVFAALVMAACGPTASVTPSVTLRASSTPSSSSGSGNAPTSPVEGVVTAIQSTGLAEVTGFTLRTSDGQSYEFTVGTLENGTEFPPGHLAEHKANAEPIRVTFRVEGGELVAVRLEDASAT